MAYEWETEEWRSALRPLSATERVTACGHTAMTHGICPDCNFNVREEM
jgi:ribosomal protein L32